MAAPVVTGSIAFLMGAYPYMTPQEVVSLVFETADDLGDAGVDAVYGHGLINLNNATQPQGELMIATGSNVKGESIAARSTTMSVPAVFKSALAAKMPRSVIAFDKYKRPYAMPISSFVKMTHSGERNFKNDLYAFSRYQPKRRIAARRQSGLLLCAGGFGRFSERTRHRGSRICRGGVCGRLLLYGKYAL